MGDHRGERRAARLQECDLALGNALLELVEQARLAAPRLADHRHDLGHVGRDSLVAGLELRQLGAPPHERRQPAGLGDGHRRDGLAHAEHLVGRHRLALSLHLEGARLAHLEEAADQPLRGGADEDRPGLGEGLKAGGEVRRVADGGVIHLEIVADGAHHDGAGVDADAHLEVVLPSAPAPFVEPDERPANGERGVHGALRGVLVGHRGAEQRHHPVARELVHDAVHPVDLGEGEGKILLEQLVVLLRIDSLGDGRGSDEVAEEHGDELSLARDRALAGPDLRDEALRDVAREAREAVIRGGRGRFRRGRGALLRRRIGGQCVAAIGAEAETGLNARGATGAGDAEGRAAGMAEPLAGENLGLASGAVHGRKSGPARRIRQGAMPIAGLKAPRPGVPDPRVPPLAPGAPT